MNLSPVAAKIAEEIRKQRVVSFARFMELALYCPVYGYYEKEGDTVGRRGDYYTSVSVGRLFGELLAWQYAEWLESRGGSSFQIVEAGAHQGALAADILGWMREWRPELFERIEYWILEPSQCRLNWQKRTLKDWTGKVRWARDWAQLERASPAETVPRVIFCNELLDALPTHRLEWDATRREWFEWGVGLEHGRFAWARIDGAEHTIVSLCSAVQGKQELLDGFTLDISPTAAEWWRQAAESLKTGWLVAFDYGLTQEELFYPERKEGTLRAYFRHQVQTDVLANPGEQDLTAHVNFSMIQQSGERAGLTTEGLWAQEQFLTRIASRIWAAGRGFPDWTRTRTRQFQTLTHPEHLGRALKVLVQATKP
jgi:SAM-dependent MidA family methyltransferase